MDYFKNINYAGYITIGIVVIFATIVIISAFYIRKQISKKGSNNAKMSLELSELKMNVAPINPADASKQYKLRDYYIMSSYNSCCNGNFKDGYVTLQALQDVIRIGNRVLDFEIYNIDDNPVVACSSSDNFNFKGSYNSIPFEKVLEVIRDNAFSASTSPTYNDPLIIHLRIKTKNTGVIEKIGKSISSILNNFRLPNKYNYEYNVDGNVENLMSEPLSSFLGKAIIMVDRSNTDFVGTGLDEVTNICSNTLFCQKQRNYDIKYAPSVDEIIEHNKKYTTISMCDLQPTSDNMDASIHMKVGCQMICMNFQNLDNNLLFYLEQFNNAGSSFILKPEQLRYVPVYAKKPVPQKPELSYAPKKISKPYFTHTL